MNIFFDSESDNSERFARGHTNLIARLVVFALLSVSILFVRPSWAGTASQPCQLREYASLPVVLLNFEPPLVAVNINGRATHMWLDVGSAVSILDDGALSRLGLKSRPLPYTAARISVGSKEVTQYAVVPTFKLNELTLRNVEIRVQPGSPIPADIAIGEAIVGRLSPTALADVDVEVDLAHGKLNLFAPSSCMGAYWSKQYAVVPMHQGPLGDWYFDMELDGKRLQSKFATSAVQSYIYTNVTKDVYGWDARSPGVEAVHAPNRGRLTHYRAMSLTTHGLSVMNAQIFLHQPIGCVRNGPILRDKDGAEAFADCLGVTPLEIGLPVLKQLRLYMAVKQQKLYFTAAEAN